MMPALLTLENVLRLLLKSLIRTRLSFLDKMTLGDTFIRFLILMTWQKLSC